MFFVAEYEPKDRTSQGGGLAEEGEDVEVLEVGLDDAASMVTRGEICDGKTVLLIQWAQLNRP